MQTSMVMPFQISLNLSKNNKNINVFCIYNGYNIYLMQLYPVCYDLNKLYY